MSRLLVLACFFFLSLTVCVAETPAEHLANLYAAQEMASHPAHANLPDYSLLPAKLAQAQHLGVLRLTLGFGSQIWTIAQLLLLLALGIVAGIRDFAVNLTRYRVFQAYIFVAIFLLVRFALSLPLSIYGHHLALVYNLSIQGWPSWFGDVAKSFGLEVLIGGALVALLFAIIRRAPQRWWLMVWVVAVPIALVGIVLTPLVVDPLFNHFEPLALHNEALTTQLEHMGVPANRQFLMQASAKVTTPNAYVTGLGPTSRIVVWDTSLTQNQLPSPEVLFMVGHESGHYALHHVLTGTLLTLVALLPLLYVAFWFVNGGIARFGARIGVGSSTDWAALPILLLVFSVLSFIAEPVSNTISRQMEHNADIYGQEAIHGVVADPQSTVRSSNDLDGARILDDPNPTPFQEFWTYDHPATGRRAAFGKAYDPWAPGMERKYFKSKE